MFHVFIDQHNLSKTHLALLLMCFHLTLSHKCLLVLQKLMFCHSVLSRWEMQAGAELNDEEKAMVEELQRAYFVCSYNVGLQDPPEADEMLAKQTRGDT